MITYRLSASGGNLSQNTARINGPCQAKEVFPSYRSFRFSFQNSHCISIEIHRSRTNCSGKPLTLVFWPVEIMNWTEEECCRNEGKQSWRKSGLRKERKSERDGARKEARPLTPLKVSVLIPSQFSVVPTRCTRHTCSPVSLRKSSVPLGGRKETAVCEKSRGR